MLEVTIIVLLAFALFVLLRHYPEVKEGSVLNEKKESMIKNFFAKFKRKSSDLEIAEAIISGQEEIVAPAKVEEILDELKDFDPEIAKKLCQADQAFSEEDLRKAEDLSIEIISLDKRCDKAYINIGKVAFIRGHFEDATEAFKTAIKCNGKAAEAYFYLGKIFFRNENPTNAIEYLQKSINLEKGHAEWYGELGIAFMDVRQYAKAAKMLKKAASLDIDNKEYRRLASEAEDKQRSHSYYAKSK